MRTIICVNQNQIWFTPPHALFLLLGGRYSIFKVQCQAPRQPVAGVHAGYNRATQTEYPCSRPRPKPYERKKTHPTKPTLFPNFSRKINVRYGLVRLPLARLCLPNPIARIAGPTHRNAGVRLGVIAIEKRFGISVSGGLLSGHNRRSSDPLLSWYQNPVSPECP